MSVLKGLSWSVPGTLLKAIAGAEFPDEEWHPISAEYINSAENVAVRATMYGRDTIDLRHAGLSVGSHEREERNRFESELHQSWATDENLAPPVTQHTQIRDEFPCSTSRLL